MSTFWKVPFLEMASNVWSLEEEKWIDDSPRFEDIDLLKKEAKGKSIIDGANLRDEMVKMWEHKEVNLRIRELPGRTRLVFLGTDEQWNQIPWTLWSRIFQAIGPVGYVLFYAHPLKREYPQTNIAIGPNNINAGYSYICDQKLVVVYRFEEATRVLLHEMLHTVCFDKEKATEDLEASTEAWTEVLLCSLLSKGKIGKFNILWKKQCKWILQQVIYLKQNYNVNSPADYAWRYTVGKYEVLKNLGFLEDCKIDKMEVGLRFTTPELDVEMY